MLRVGEDTGSLDDQLDTVASFYEKELDYKVKQITTLMEPAVLIVMGVIVGFVALALVSAMYGIYGDSVTLMRRTRPRGPVPTRGSRWSRCCSPSRSSAWGS